MSESFWSASNFSMPSGEKRTAGVNYFSALVSSINVWVATSTYNTPGICVCYREKYTMSAVCLYLVFEM